MRITIDGIEIAYRLHGSPGAPATVITPGGRFSKDSAGIAELAEALAAAGRLVVTWDRPNCGESDISFAGTSESALQADLLAKLVRSLDIGPVALLGGSGGARVSIIAAARNPQIVSQLAVWWITGGLLGSLTLAAFYCIPSAIAASRGGMERVAEMPEWRQLIARNPRNRDILLGQDPAAFIGKMEQWASVYVPQDGFLIPGMSQEDWGRLKMPVRVYRSSPKDLAHPFETSEAVHQAIPHSEFVAPPWGEDEWNQRSDFAMQHGDGHFAGWPALAPGLLEFLETGAPN